MEIEKNNRYKLFGKIIIYAIVLLAFLYFSGFAIGKAFYNYTH